jgi:hypothetical protein
MTRAMTCAIVRAIANLGTQAIVGMGNQGGEGREEKRPNADGVRVGEAAVHRRRTAAAAQDQPWRVTRGVEMREGDRRRS